MGDLANARLAAWLAERYPQTQLKRTAGVPPKAEEKPQKGKTNTATSIPRPVLLGGASVSDPPSADRSPIAEAEEPAQSGLRASEPRSHPVHPAIKAGSAVLVPPQPGGTPGEHTAETHIPGPGGRERLPLEVVLEARDTCIAVLGLRHGIMTGPSRSREHVRPRQIIMYFLFKLYRAKGYSKGDCFWRIGQAFGDRDRTTVMSGVHVVEARVAHGFTDTIGMVKKLAKEFGFDPLAAAVL